MEEYDFTTRILSSRFTGCVGGGRFCALYKIIISLGVYVHVNVREGLAFVNATFLWICNSIEVLILLLHTATKSSWEALDGFQFFVVVFNKGSGARTWFIIAGHSSTNSPLSRLSELLKKKLKVVGVVTRLSLWKRSCTVHHLAQSTMNFEVISVFSFQLFLVPGILVSE